MTENEFKDNLIKKLKKLKINKTKNLFITSELSILGKTNIQKEKLLKIILDTLKKIMGKNYSIFSPSSTMNLCNSNKIFDIKKTKSYMMGPLAEYIRSQKNSVRSIHPYWSVVCIGKNSNLLKKVSPHAYGAGSSWDVMLNLDTVQLNLGIHPSKAVSLVHHIETVVGVPYRYNKEFIHKIKSYGKIYKKKFYLSSMYLNKDIKKKKKLNQHFFNKMKNLRLLKHEIHRCGLNMWSFKMTDFYKVSLEFFIKDIYTYLEKVPKLKKLKR